MKRISINPGVRMTCTNCNGFGYFNFKDEPSEQWPNGRKEVCKECNGLGKIKVKESGTKTLKYKEKK
jgi:DnaJ-class molecular chaperone